MINEDNVIRQHKNSKCYFVKTGMVDIYFLILTYKRVLK